MTGVYFRQVFILLASSVATSLAVASAAPDLESSNTAFINIRVVS